MEKVHALGSKFMQGHDKVYGPVRRVTSKFDHLSRAVSIGNTVADVLRSQADMSHAIAARTASRASERWADTVSRRARQHGPMTAQVYLNEYGLPQLMPYSESLGTPAQMAAARARHAR